MLLRCFWKWKIKKKYTFKHSEFCYFSVFFFLLFILICSYLNNCRIITALQVTFSVCTPAKIKILTTLSRLSPWKWIKFIGNFFLSHIRHKKKIDNYDLWNLDQSRVRNSGERQEPSKLAKHQARPDKILKHKKIFVVLFLQTQQLI